MRRGDNSFCRELDELAPSTFESLHLPFVELLMGGSPYRCGVVSRSRSFACMSVALPLASISSRSSSGWNSNSNNNNNNNKTCLRVPRCYPLQVHGTDSIAAFTPLSLEPGADDETVPPAAAEAESRVGNSGSGVNAVHERAEGAGVSAEKEGGEI